MSENVNATLDEVLRETNVSNNPYFVALRDESFDKLDFIETQIQFYYAVVFFSRPMAVVAAKIPSSHLRMEVMRNVWEEHGEGTENKIHGRTFREFLWRLGQIDGAGVESRPLWPEIRAFNTALTGCAMADDWEVATACFGTIERMFVDISHWIGKAVVERGWLAADNLIHYDLHEDLDVKHSEDFFAVLRDGTDGSPEAMYCIEQGMRLGAYIFDSLYRGLYHARHRRLDPIVGKPQPHIYRP